MHTAFSLTLQVLLAAVPLAEVAPAPADPTKSYLEASAKMIDDWRGMKFGMFVCWGPVTLTGREIGWSRGGERRGRKGTGPTPVEVYDNLYKEWKPEKFDARQWARVARDAGARYMIFLVKHHDGYCLYDTKLTDYKSTSPEAAWRHDVMADVAKACHEADLKLFIYYSQPDWHHPDYRTESHARYIQYLHGQIRELLTNYGHVDGLWFDGLGGNAEDWDAASLFRMARQIQPHLIINNRCGLPGDFDTPEQRVGHFQSGRPWESCITLGTQWSWKPDDKIKSLDECIETLVRCVGGDGNLALNTNPMPDGRIEPRQAERFREIGKWLGQYGESVYATRGGPFKPARWGAATRKGKTIYLHVLNWPGESLTLPAIPKSVVTGSLLTGGEVKVSQDSKGLTIAVAPEHRHAIDTIVKLGLDGPAGDIAPIADRSGSVAVGKSITASSVWPSPGYEPIRAIDDDPSTRWGAGQGARSGWLEVDLGEPITIDRVEISEAYDRVRRFVLEIKDGDTWRTCVKGTKIGSAFVKRFRPVAARHVRLNVLEATDVPTIWELRIFRASK
ncbi:MAG: alpha-L-fucosidase [Phycisphaerae bacterium]|nr:alpha-L-fucosidase [Phycisphaerae bacterium]